MASKYGHGSGDISSFYGAAQRVSCPNRPFPRSADRVNGKTADLVELATSSDYAAARGKRGGGERRLCTCTAHRIETTEHVVLECELYAAQREPLTEAITEWSAAMQGLSAQEALHWAINDKLPSPVMHTEDRKAAGAALRAALLDFHRLVKSAQYIKPRDAAPQPPAVN